MKYSIFFRIVLICSVLCGGLSVAHAVTDKEMDQARAIAAQCYLRYANDGSGYLDDFQATSMKELEGKLKTKEKENLKAFLSVGAPSDYASWDKAKLVEYWSVTVFSSPKLEAKGKAAKTRVKARLTAMNVKAPEKAEEKTPVETTAEQSTPVPEQAEVSSDPTSPNDIADQLADEGKSAVAAIDSLQAEIEEEQLQKLNADETHNSTWIYVAILVVLIIVVIILVVYAAKSMKGGETATTPKSQQDTDQLDAMREKFTKTLAAKNEELRSATELFKEEKARADEAERRAKESEIQLREAKKEIDLLQARLIKTEESDQSVEPVSRNINREEQPAPRTRKIYLGRVNQRGIFVRADRGFDPSHDVYCLETSDGITGSFYVVPDETLCEMILIAPEQTLGLGAEGNFKDAAGAERVETEMRGTALLEDGRWRVARKARIRFE